MSLIDRAKSAYGASYGAMSQPVFGGYRSNFADQGWASGLSPVIRQLADCFNEDYILKDPREYLMVYRAMAEKLGFVSIAYSRKIDLIGLPEVVSDDTGFADEMNAALREIRYCGEISGDFTHKSGLSGLVSATIRSTFTDGHAFVSMTDRNGDLLQRASQRLEYIRVHDSARLRFMEIQPDVVELWYTRRGMQTTMKENPAFLPVTFRDSRYVWGLPLSYECEAMVSMWLTAAGNRQGAHFRLGNPTSVTLLGYEIDKDFNPAVAKLVTDMSKAGADEAATKFRAALANANRTYKPQDIVATIPGTKPVITTKMIGEGARAITEYVPELEFMTLLCAIPLNYPPELIGLRTMSGGIGSEQFKYAADAAMADAGTHRIKLEGQLMKPIVNRLATSMSRRIPEYGFEWIGTSLANQQALADVEKTKAETLKTQIEAFQAAKTDLGPETIRQIAEDMGKEWE